MPHRRLLLGATLALPALARAETLPALARAETLPTLARAEEALRQVTVVVAFPAGGATDGAARLVAAALKGSYAANAIVDNRTGAGGRLGTEHVKQAPADGSVLLYTPAFPLMIFPHIYRRLGYDALRDFTPVVQTTRGVHALSVGPAVPDGVRTIADFIAWCRANPEKAQFGAPSGSSQHFAGAMFARAAGIELTLVPYRGGAPVVTDLVGGHLAAGVNPLPEVLPQQGRGLRILATTGAQRSRFTPDVPTLAEAGYPTVVFQDWSGVLAPAGTPAPLLQRVHALVSDLLRSAAGAAAFARLGAEPEPTTMAAFDAGYRRDFARYADVVRATGFVAED